MTTDQDLDGEKYKTSFNLAVENNSMSIMAGYITENATVLDVGCACGDFGVGLKNAELYGLEYNKESAAIAQKTGAYQEVLSIDLNQIDENTLPQYHAKFDFIICGDVLEHLRNPKQCLTILKSYLKPDGFIVASIPNVAHMSVVANLLINDFTYTSKGLLDETHLHFFAYKSIANDMSSLNLKIEECGFTMVDKNAEQPNDPYPLLPVEIQKFLFKGYHPYVFQYVVKMSVSADSKDNLLKNNLEKLDINGLTAPFYILNYRAALLQELFLADL